VVPVANAICDQSGTPATLFFNGRAPATPTTPEPFTALDVNSGPGLFETFWFVDPQTRNISRILTRARSIFNDSAMSSSTTDTFGYSYDQWMAYSLPAGFNQTNETTIALNVSRSTAVSLNTTTVYTEAATSRVYAADQFPLSYLYNCSRADLSNTSTSLWGLQCTVTGYTTPSVTYASRLTCVNSTTFGVIPITNTSFPNQTSSSQARINVEFGAGSMLDSVICFSSVPIQVTIENTEMAPLLDRSSAWITSVYMTSFESLAYPDALVVYLSETGTTVPLTVISQALNKPDQISLTCDGNPASIMYPTASSAGQFVLKVQNCTSALSLRRPPREVALTWPASILYTNGKILTSAFTDPDVEVRMAERVLDARCIDGAIFILFDQEIAVSASNNSFVSTCTLGGLSLRGALGRTVVVDVQVPGPCPFSFNLRSGSHVYLNGSWYSCSDFVLIDFVSFYSSNPILFVKKVRTWRV
jgi:hypothetical protein